MLVGLGRLDNPPALADLVEIGPIAELHPLTSQPWCELQ